MWVDWIAKAVWNCCYAPVVTPCSNNCLDNWRVMGKIVFKTKYFGIKISKNWRVIAETSTIRHRWAEKMIILNTVFTSSMKLMEIMHQCLKSWGGGGRRPWPTQILKICEWNKAHREITWFMHSPKNFLRNSSTGFSNHSEINSTDFDSFVHGFRNFICYSSEISQKIIKEKLV